MGQSNSPLSDKLRKFVSHEVILGHDISFNALQEYSQNLFDYQASDFIYSYFNDEFCKDDSNDGEYYRIDPKEPQVVEI